MIFFYRMDKLLKIPLWKKYASNEETILIVKKYPVI